ncbi:MAG: hypothetical protein ACI9YT_000607 [Halobacteriales archaeon]|jgi:hypothetical protein
MTEFDAPTEPCDPVLSREDERDPDCYARDVVAAIENRDDGPDECTLFPCDVDGVDLMTTWMTAHGDAFVGLESMR